VKIANLNIQKLGNFEDYTNKNKYSIKQFKSDFKDYQLNQSLNKEKRDLIEQKLEVPKHLKEGLLSTQQGYENFLSICMISGSTFFNTNIGKIKKIDNVKSLLSYNASEESSKNYTYKRSGQNYYVTPDHVSFTLSVINSMERLEIQVGHTQKVAAWINVIFWEECEKFLRPNIEQIGFHDKLLKRVKDIVRNLDTNQKLIEIKQLLDSLQIKFVEIYEGKNPIGFYMVIPDQDEQDLYFDTNDDIQHKENIIMINTILAQYKIKKLPSSEESTASDAYDKIHAARRGMIFDNKTLVNIMKSCCESLGVVAYSTLHESFKQRLSNIQYIESTSVDQLNFESKIESLNSKIYSEEYREDELDSLPTDFVNTSEIASANILDFESLTEIEIESLTEIEMESILEENLKNSLELRSSLDMETEYVPEEISDGEISSENDDEESGSETESSYELEDSNFDEEKYIIKPLFDELSNMLEKLSIEFIDLHEDLEIFIVKALEVIKNSEKVKKVTQSSFDNEEYSKYERGKEYFERLEQKLIYDGKLDNSDPSYKVGLVITIKKSLERKI